MLHALRRHRPDAFAPLAHPLAGTACLLVALTLVVTATFAVIHHLAGERLFALANAGLAIVSGASVLWARDAHHARRAVRVVAATLVAVLAWQTLVQGPALPAAAWWLSVLPFMLAAAELYAMALATVALFVGIVVVLHVGDAGAFGPLAIVPAAPWQHLAAVIGSECLAVGVIAHCIRQRCAATRALDEARAAAVCAAAAKSRLLATVSHEVRTPLHGVVGIAQLLKRTDLDATRRAQLLELQEHSARALLARVNDLLDWSKLEAGKVTLEARPLNLRRIVSEATELFAVQAYAKGIELTWSCSPDVPRSAVGDAMRLRQVIDNLVGNAVKFTATGGVHIHVALEPVVPPGSTPSQRFLRIEVADSGIGIDAHRLPTLFAPYAQADESVARRYGGTGLGLAICRELAQMMGGRIDVASVPGSGSTFTLIVALGLRPGRRPAGPPARMGVVLSSASPGVQRHLKTVLHDLHVEPIVLNELPAGDVACGLLLVDAPLLSALPHPQVWLRAQLQAGLQVAVITPLGGDHRVDVPDGVLRLYKPVRRRALKAVLDAVDVAPSRDTEPCDFMPTLPEAGPHVLVAEDNAVNQMVVQAMLNQLGATSVLAVDGREALQCLAAECFDLVLMDVQMPELDGLSATRAWRATEALKGVSRTPIVAMTAHAAADEASACRAAGMDAYLAKPFDARQLDSVLRAWRRGRTPAANPPSPTPAAAS